MSKIAFFMVTPQRAVLLAALALATPAWPQQRVLTLLPTYTASQDVAAKDIVVGGTKGCAYLYFNTDSLPDSAAITDIRLRLKYSLDGDEYQQIDIVTIVGEPKEPDWNRCPAKGQAGPHFSTQAPRKGDIASARVAGSLSSRPKSIALFLAPINRELFERSFYGPNSKESDDNDKDTRSFNLPRLVITYMASGSPPDPTRSDGWPAVHSPREFITHADRFIQGVAGQEASEVEAVLNSSGGPQGAIGPEGNRYTIDGLSLVARSRSGQEIWRCLIGVTNLARVTVSPNGRYLYAVGKLEGDPVFYAINAATGSVAKLPRLLPEQMQGLWKGILYFHNPVVLQEKDGDSVFLTANSGDRGLLLRIKNKRASDPSSDPTSDAVLADAKLSDLGTGFQVSQAILSGTKLYYIVKDFKNELGGAIRRLDAESKDFRFASSGPDQSLWRKANPVLDSSGNLIFYDNQTLYLFNLNRNSVLPVPFANAGPPAQLAFAPSGRLYTRTSEGLRPVIPSFDGWKYESLSSPVDMEVISVDPKTGMTKPVPEGKTLRLTACGDILLAKGFAVDEKAGLSVERRFDCPSK